MLRIMGDHDIEGQFNHIIRFFKSPTWKEVWESIGLTDIKFTDLGLSENSPDVLVWQTCQEQQVILVTGNRNYESPDSLEATIRQYNRVDSLPVFTIGDPTEFSLDRSYAERATERLLEYLSELDRYRGAGRLYIP
jgi:hypothetical protein